MERASRRTFIVAGAALAAVAATSAVTIVNASGMEPRNSRSPSQMHDDALIVVDVQNDFTPGGRLAVKDGDQVIGVINELATRFTNIVLTHGC